MIWVIQYRDLFRDIFFLLALLPTSDFCRLYQEFTYTDLVHSGFVTLRRNYSHLIGTCYVRISGEIILEDQKNGKYRPDGNIGHLFFVCLVVRSLSRK